MYFKGYGRLHDAPRDRWPTGSSSGSRNPGWWSATRYSRFVLTAFVVVVVGLSLACASDAEPDASDLPAPPQPLNALQQQAQQVLAERLSVSADDLALVSDEAVEWADSSLGCPEAGMMYAQVITPGHRITFSYAGNDYEVHTSGGGDSGSPAMMVSCEGGTSY